MIKKGKKEKGDWRKGYFVQHKKGERGGELRVVKRSERRSCCGGKAFEGKSPKAWCGPGKEKKTKGGIIQSTFMTPEKEKGKQEEGGKGNTRTKKRRTSASPINPPIRNS